MGPSISRAGSPTLSGRRRAPVLHASLEVGEPASVALVPGPDLGLSVVGRFVHASAPDDSGAGVALLRGRADHAPASASRQTSRHSRQVKRGLPDQPLAHIAYQGPWRT